MAGPDGEHELVRPFMAAGAPRPAAPAAAADTTGGEPLFRPYLLTGGRVPEDGDVLDRTYVRSAGARPDDAALGHDHRRLLELCADAQSVAEMSALLHLPLGTVAVMALDLAAAGHLSGSASGAEVASDTALIWRLRDAIAAL